MRFAVVMGILGVASIAGGVSLYLTTQTDQVIVEVAMEGLPNPDQAPQPDLPSPSDRFSPTAAMGYLEAICQLGPRITASAAMAKQISWLEEHFRALKATVRRQRFYATQGSRGKKNFLVENLVIEWHPARPKRVLIGCHYDTRPYADQDPVIRNRQKPFLGANDGASGVALLMELGKQMPGLACQVGVDFVFFDAEEYIFDTRKDLYFIGSRYFADEFAKSHPGYHYDAVVIVDMVGDKNLTIHPDRRSIVNARNLVDEVWAVARDLRATAFKAEEKYDILDDHTSFHPHGIPAIVLIDFDYRYWHTLADTPDKCSGESLAEVAGVIIEWIRRQ